MSPDLQRALEQIGWDEIYSRHIPNLGPVTPRGERRSTSPFPDTVDTNPSFSVNIVNGLWRCWNSNRGGNYVNFRSIMDATEFDPVTGLAVQDYAATQRALAVEFGVVNPVSADYIAERRDALFNDPALQAALQRFKPWDRQTLYNLNIGYDYEINRFVIPAYDRQGRLQNARLYQPGGEPKMLWLRSGLNGNFVFPHSGWRETDVVLVEGETDAISLRSFGFTAISGTVSSSDPVPHGEWWQNTRVWLWLDDDRPGREAQATCIESLVGQAREVRVVTWPTWEGKPDNADPSDYIRFLLDSGLERDQVVREITRLLQEAETIQFVDPLRDREPSQLSFTDALSSSNLGERIRFTAKVIAKSSHRFVLPIEYRLQCPADGHAYCRRCPMHNQFRGNGRFVHNPRSIDTLKLIQVTERTQLDTVKQLQGVVPACPDPRLSIERGRDIEAVILSAPIHSGEVQEGEIGDTARRESYVVLDPELRLEENRIYHFNGYVYPHPKTQSAVFLLDSYEQASSRFDTFEATPEVVRSLLQYRPEPNQDILAKLYDVAADLSDSVTMIRGRPDLHVAYRCVWHSAISFSVFGSRVKRGWLELIVVGDTRCGKSDVFKKMSAHYDLGVIIDCKTMSLPGIVGTVVQSSSGEFYVTAGVVPQQDRGIVCFDEYQTPKFGQPSLIESLASARSEGVVRITKAASAEFYARVRQIWLANPGSGKLMVDIADSGVEVIQNLIRQPEDIARFDFAMAVSQTEVPSDVINDPVRPRQPRYSRESARSLLAWIYSRTPDQIVFAPHAEGHLVSYARQMSARYDAAIPLVEVADQRMRLARLAVSIAGQCFSTDNEFNNLIVTDRHVEAAARLMGHLYDSPVMDYSGYSERSIEDRTIVDEAAVSHVLQANFRDQAPTFARELLRLDTFSEDTVTFIMPPGSVSNVQLVLRSLKALRCLKFSEHGRVTTFEKTPAFVRFLKNYMASRGIIIP